MVDKMKRELVVARSVRIDECSGGIYAIEVDGAVEFAASKITLADRLGSTFGISGELAAIAAPKAKRGRKPKATQPVLAPAQETPAAPRKGVTVIKSNGEEA